MANIKDTIFFVNRNQEERHTEELAKKMNLSYTNLTNYPLTREVLSLVEESSAARYQLIPYLKVGKNLKLGAVDPNDPDVKTFLDDYQAKNQCEVTVSVVSKTSFLYGLSFYEKYKKEDVKKKEEELAEDITVDIGGNDVESVADALKKANVSKLLEVIVVGAINTNSSDIHFEPTEINFLIRYRIDGILRDVISLPLQQYKGLISRIKFLSKLRMDLEDVPQDGRFSFRPSNVSDEVDIRVSVMPSTFGESIVLRLLGQEKSILKLDLLGFRSDALAVVKKAIAKPFGMILTSGPTGSGKTSTLYAILLELKKPGKKIITLENPVEYKIEGIEQSQMKPGAGYEFADGLKASLRQDPDILMVGEIRDAETAEIAVQAALTGHLMLSTIHANSAPAVFARLLEIGVKPFLLSGSINLIMAQRLVRKVCEFCKEEYPIPPEEFEEIKKVLRPIASKIDPKLTKLLGGSELKLPRGKGCVKCGKTGYTGRQAIIEVLEPDDKIELLIANKSSIAEFQKAASAQGMMTMEQDGLMKALEGKTTVEEVWRVTKS